MFALVSCLSFAMLQCLRELVPGVQAADSAGHGQDYEGQPCIVCVERAYPEGAAALLLRAYGALPLLTKLRRALLQPDHLVS